MGSAAAWQLAGNGLDVVALEQFAPGHERGSSHGRSRIFRLAYQDALYVGLARRALTKWGELEQETGEKLLTQTGGIDHGDRGALERIRGALESENVAYELLSADDAASRWGGMRFGGAVLFQPEGGRVDADAAVAAMQRGARARGAEMRFDEQVRSIRIEDDAAKVETDGDVIEAPVAIVTAGAWVKKLIGQVVSLPPLRITQEQPAHFAPSRPGQDWPSFVHHFPPDATEGMSGVGAYGLETPGEGIKVGEHGTGPVVDPDVRDFQPESPGIARLQHYVERWLPGIDPHPVSVISCLYTTTPDEHFVIDRKGPLVVGSACSGHGFKFAPAVGEVLADLAMGRTRAPAVWRLPARENRSIV
jgi:sarcosine oxidase